MRRSAAPLLVLLLCGAASGRDMPSRALIEDARDQVFARPEFRRVVTQEESALMVVLETLAEAVTAFAEENPLAFRLIVIGLGLTAAILIAHIVWTIVVARQARYAPEPELPVLDLRRSQPEAFRDRALALAKEGRFDDAVRELYAALILTLDARGDLRYARHKALLDYRHEARAEDARAALEAMAAGYHPTAFGRRHLPGERFEMLLERLDEVRR